MMPEQICAPRKGAAALVKSIKFCREESRTYPEHWKKIHLFHSGHCYLLLSTLHLCKGGIAWSCKYTLRHRVAGISECPRSPLPASPGYKHLSFLQSLQWYCVVAVPTGQLHYSRETCELDKFYILSTLQLLLRPNPSLINLRGDRWKKNHIIFK